MDDIILLCMYYFESQGFVFNKSSGGAVQVTKTENEDEDYFWFSSSPYIMHHREKWKSVDGFKEIVKSIKHKEFWAKKCEYDLSLLLEKNDKHSYQIQVNTQDLTAHKEDVTEFLDDYKNLKISSPMATRKSNIIDEVVRQSHARGLRVLFITNRVSLSKDISQKYNIMHYQNALQYKSGDSLVVQFDSLKNFVKTTSLGDFAEFDVVILDEFTSLMLYMTNTYEGKEYRYLENLYAYFILLEDKKFVVSDSFIIDFPLEGNTLGIYNNFRENHTLTEYVDYEQFRKKIIRSCNATKSMISISSNEKRFLTKMKAQLEFHGKKVLLLTGDTENKQAVYKIFANTDLHKEFDAVLFSPTLTVGVSIFAQVSVHFHYDTSGTINVIDSIQMLRRTRNAKEVCYYIKGKSSYKDTDILNIQRTMPSPYKLQNQFQKELGVNQIGESLSHLRLMNNIFSNTHKYAFKALLKHQFKNVI